MGISGVALNKIKIAALAQLATPDNAKMYQSFEFIQPAATGKCNLNKFTNKIERSKF